MDNYSLDLFRLCPKKFYWRIEEDLVDATKPISPALSYGIAMHEALAQPDVESAMAAFGEAYKDHCNHNDERRTMLLGLDTVEEYFEHYKNDGVVTEQVEIGFTASINDNIVYTGRIDKLVTFEGEPMVMEHKTTALPLFKAQPSPHNQITGYMYAAGALTGKPYNKCILDLIKVSKKGPEFHRVITDRTPEQFDEWRQSIIQTRLMIDACRARNTWPQNAPTACSMWGAECEYLPLCLSNWTGEPPAGMYRREKWQPYE